MLQTLQPHRPRTSTSSQSARNPLNQQQTRAFHAQASHTATHSTTTSPPSPTEAAAPAVRAPRNQMEAMPPTSTAAAPLPFSFHPQPLQRAPQLQSRPPFFDPAMCHPVFFSAALRRCPFPPLPNPAFIGAGTYNPVAFGYIHENNGARKEGSAKL